jgi:hypothetical protein
MINQLSEVLSLTPEQQEQLAAWAKTNVKTKTCKITLSAEDVEAYGFADQGHLVDTYRQKAALEARLLHSFTLTEVPREDGKVDLTLMFTIQAVK